jgi:glycosyltransferase involved in cell wall biosynthesis
MRVLMVNRPDALEKPGGDVVQMQETARALGYLGVDVELRYGPQEARIYKEFDAVHLFNLQTPAFTVEEARKVSKAGVPLAISTVYWDFGAEQLLLNSAKWQAIRRVVGKRIALVLAQKRVEQVAAHDRRQMGEILERADVWLPNSRAEIAHLERLTKERKPVVVVPNGIDTERFDPARKLPKPAWAEQFGGRPYILVVARVDRDKNQLAYCRAMQHPLGLPAQVAAEAGVTELLPIVLAGWAPDPSLLQACQEAGAVYVGPLQGDDLVAAYAHTRIHALPSLRETPGLASLEAAAMECAVVTTSLGSAEEYFGDRAHYCDPTSEKSMWQATFKAFAQGRRQDISAYIRDRYSWKAAAQKTLEAYEYLGR